MSAEPEPICLACDAARRDAADMVVMAVEDGFTSDRIHHLVDAMDRERAWRVALFLAGVAAGLVDVLADQVDIKPAEIAEQLRKEMTSHVHE